jgi:hypothetical protein
MASSELDTALSQIKTNIDKKIKSAQNFVGGVNPYLGNTHTNKLLKAIDEKDDKEIHHLLKDFLDNAKWGKNDGDKSIQAALTIIGYPLGESNKLQSLVEALEKKIKLENAEVKEDNDKPIIHENNSKQNQDNPAAARPAAPAAAAASAVPLAPPQRPAAAASAAPAVTSAPAKLIVTEDDPGNKASTGIEGHLHGRVFEKFTQTQAWKNFGQSQKDIEFRTNKDDGVGDQSSVLGKIIISITAETYPDKAVEIANKIAAGAKLHNPSYHIKSDTEDAAIELLKACQAGKIKLSSIIVGSTVYSGDKLKKFMEDKGVSTPAAAASSTPPVKPPAPATLPLGAPPESAPPAKTMTPLLNKSIDPTPPESNTTKDSIDPKTEEELKNAELNNLNRSDTEGGPSMN